MLAPAGGSAGNEHGVVRGGGIGCNCLLLLLLLLYTWI